MTGIGREDLRVAVVGVGRMGANHARIYSSLKGVELVGLYDENLVTARSVASRYGCRAFDSLGQLAANADAASVAVPSASHADVAGYLLEQGLHCLVEKPLANARQDCLALIQAAESRNLVLLVGHVERFNPVIRQLTSILSDVAVHAFDVRRMSATGSRVTDVDVVADLMVHDIDVILSLATSEVSGVSAHGVKVRGQAGYDYVSSCLQFADGSIATLAASRITQNKIREMHVTTDLGFVAATYSSQELLIYRQAADTTPMEAVERAGNYALELAIERVLIRAQEPLVLELQHFVDVVRGGGEPLVSGHDALKALNLVWQIGELLSTEVVEPPLPVHVL